MHLIATAGHVDHGKSTLVRALTGIEPDRLAEEKKRGLTIDLGFAWTELPSGNVIAFVDVPGHSRYLKNMLAGIGAADAVLFVVSAAEGWKPQSEEHLRILQLLGFEHGIVALTHSSSVDDDIRELAHMDLEDHLAGSFLKTAPVIELDVPGDLGISELTEALDTLTATTPPSPDHGRPRLWIDRVFAIEGAGTVVTGSLTDGRITSDQELLLLPQRRSVRVRGIQSRGNQTDSVGPGERTAVNLSGISHHEITRGDVLVLDDQWHETSSFDVDLHVLETLDHEVRRRGAYVVHIGSGHFRAQIRILGDEALLPGDSGPARVHLPTTLPLLPGDRFILRDSGRELT
ncbi:MAG: selenocysteine-specific translation elongation factor, partial [Acidimicrobiales bacterium]